MHSALAGTHSKASHTRSVCSGIWGTTQASWCSCQEFMRTSYIGFPNGSGPFLSCLFLVQTTVCILFGFLSRKNSLNSLSAGLVTCNTADRGPWPVSLRSQWTRSPTSTALQSNVFFSLSVAINLPTGRPVTVHHVSPAPRSGSGSFARGARPWSVTQAEHRDAVPRLSGHPVRLPSTGWAVSRVNTKI